MKISTSFKNREELLLDLRVFGDLVALSSQTLEEKRKALYAEFETQMPKPTMELKRYEISRAVSDDYLIAYNSNVELSSNEELCDLTTKVETTIRQKLDTMVELPSSIKTLFSYSSRVTDSMRDEILAKYDIETGEDLDISTSRIVNTFGTVETNTDNIVSDEEIDELLAGDADFSELDNALESTEDKLSSSDVDSVLNILKSNDSETDGVTEEYKEDYEEEEYEEEYEDIYEEEEDEYEDIESYNNENEYTDKPYESIDNNSGIFTSEENYYEEEKIELQPKEVLGRQDNVADSVNNYEDTYEDEEVYEDTYEDVEESYEDEEETYEDIEETYEDEEETYEDVEETYEDVDVIIEEDDDDITEDKDEIITDEEETYEDEEEIYEEEEDIYEDVEDTYEDEEDVYEDIEISGNNQSTELQTQEVTGNTRDDSGLSTNSNRGVVGGGAIFDFSDEDLFDVVDDVPEFIPKKQEVKPTEPEKPVVQRQEPVKARSEPTNVQQEEVPTDLRKFLRAHPHCEISEVLKYFSKKEIELELRKGRIIKRGNTLRAM